MNEVNLIYRDRVRYTLFHADKGSIVIDEPIGWNEDSKEYSRHKKYAGIVTKLSNSLEFVENGAGFINEIEEQYGVNAEITLVKEIRHPHTDEWIEDYRGVLDLSKWGEKDFKVSVKFNSSGTETVLKSRESQKIEIERQTDLYGNDVEEIQTYPLEFEGRKIFLFSEFEADTSTTRVTTDIYRRKNSNWGESSVPVPIRLATRSDELLNNPIPVRFRGHNINTVSPDLSSVFYGINDRKKTLRLSLKGSFKVQNTDHVRIDPDDVAIVALKLSVYKGGNNFEFKKDYDLWIHPRPHDKNTTVTASFDKNLAIDLEEGDSLVLRYFAGAQNGWDFHRGAFIHKYYDLETVITISEDSFFEKSNAKLVLAEDLGEKLTEIITGKKNAFRYELPKGRKGYSCGHWLRKFDKIPSTENNKYKPFSTSFKDYIDDLMVTENAGLAIEKDNFKEQIVIKPLSEFYVDHVTIRLPYQVSNYEREIADKKYYSNIEAGYEKGWNNEEAMGLDVYNAQSSFTTPITRIVNTYRIVSKYIYSSYAGEFIRRKPKSKFPSVDHQYDKEIFGFDLKYLFGAYFLRKWEDDFAEPPKNIYSPETAYNLRYTPVNILFRHAFIIAASVIKNTRDFLRFGTSKGNSKLITDFPENEDIPCTAFGKPIYEPKIIKFDHAVDFRLKELLEGSTVISGKEVKNIYGKIEFINNKGEYERGWFQNLKPNGKGQWTLLKAL